MSEQVDTAPLAAKDSRGPKPIWSYALAFVTVGVLIKLLWRVRYLHRERVPAEGPLILAANHRSYLDPPAVALGTARRRPVHYMAKSEMFQKFPGNWFLPAMMSFPVHRETADRAAIKAAISILAENGVVGMFPEGTRVHAGDTGNAQAGVAFIAMRTRTRIVPVGIVGTDKAWPPGQALPKFPPVTICYGEPIDPREFEDLPREARLTALTEAVMNGIDTSVEEADEYARSR